MILGGRSLGGAETAIYAAWDFPVHPGYKDVAGMVGIGGGPFLRLGASATTVVDVPQYVIAARNAFLRTIVPWLRKVRAPAAG